MAKTYLEKLQHPKWQKKRLKILERDNWKCIYCDNEEKQLQIHHLKYTEKLPHNEPDINLVTVCCDCHKIVEYLKNPIYKDLGRLHSVSEHENHYFCFFLHHVVFLHKKTITHVICIQDTYFHKISNIYKKYHSEKEVNNGETFF